MTVLQTATNAVTIRELPAAAYPTLHAAATWQFGWHLITGGTMTIIVAERAGVILGYLQHTANVIYGIEVAIPHRECGVGRALVAALQQHYPQIEAGLVDNAAFDFWARLGFFPAPDDADDDHAESWFWHRQAIPE